MRPGLGRAVTWTPLERAALRLFAAADPFPLRVAQLERSPICGGGARGRCRRRYATCMVRALVERGALVPIGLGWALAPDVRAQALVLHHIVSGTIGVVGEKSRAA